MLSLFKPFHLWTKLAAVKRRAKTPGALYRLLADDFAASKACNCSCMMPMVAECESERPDEPNWRVETLWYGCRECQTALAEVVRRNARLFDMKKLPKTDTDMPLQSPAVARAA